METTMETIQVIELTYEMRTALGLAKSQSRQSNFRPFASIGFIKQVKDKLPMGSRFIVRYSGSMLPVMGWQANLSGGGIEQRASLNEGRHSFQGVDFVFDPEGYLCLQAGNESSQPWCRLSFSQEDKPGFELAILTPGITTAHAEFI